MGRCGTGTCEFSPAPVRGRPRRARTGWLPAANPLPTAFFGRRECRVVWAMGIECVAELRDHDCSAVVTFYLAVRRGYSPLEMVSVQADQAFVDALGRRMSS